MIIHYKLFESTEEMAKFQRDNKVSIYQTTPYPISVGNDSESKALKVDVKMGCFVTFSYDNEVES